MQWMEKGRSSRRHPQVLIGLVVASLLLMIGFQATSGIKPLSKTSRLERMQTVDLGRSLSLRDKDCDNGGDFGCRSGNAAPGIGQDAFSLTAVSVDLEARARLVAVAVAPQASRDFASVVPRAPPHLMY